MQNYITSNNQIYGFSEDQSSLIPQDAIEIPNSYTPDQYPYLSLVNGKIVFDSAKFNQEHQAQTIAFFNEATQTYLNATAQSWDYDSILSAVTYVNSNNAQFSAEGTALSNWRDAVWVKAFEIEAGLLPATTQEFLLLLPPPPAKPVVKS